MILIDYSQIAIAAIIREMHNDDDYSFSDSMCEHIIWSSLRKYNQMFKSEYGNIVVCCDGKNSWRKQLFPNYKANRKKNRDDDIVDWDALYAISNKVRESIKEQSPYLVLHIDNVEADDIIYHLSQDKSEKHVVISSDHDLQQCSVPQYNPKTDEWVEKPYSLIEHIAGGDKGDGIPNCLSDLDCFVDGVRQTVFAKSRKEVVYTEDEEAIEELSQKLLSEKKITKSIAERLDENAALIDLRRIPESIIEKIEDDYIEQNKRPVRQHTGLMIYFRKANLKRLASDYKSFF